MEQQPAAITQLKREFEAHQRSGAATPFRPSPEVSRAFGKLVRDLESKRQLGELTAPEKSWLRSVDQLLTRTTTAKSGPVGPRSGNLPPGKTGSLVYDLHAGGPQEETEEVEPNFVPKISAADAERIISQLNQQFEEKVMKKIRAKHPLDNAAIPEHVEFGPGEQSVAAGPNLDEYLTKVRSDRPNLPFLDEDSYKDLSQLAKNDLRPQQEN